MVDQITEDVKKGYIKEQPCFSGLFDSETEVLASLFMETHFKKGNLIVKQGDRVDSVFIIIDGECDVQVSTVKNGEIETKSVATLGPGQAIGLSESGFYSLTGRRTATVIAKTDMTTLKLSVASFNGFALSNHHVTEVMRNFAGSILDTE